MLYLPGTLLLCQMGAREPAISTTPWAPNHACDGFNAHTGIDGTGLAAFKQFPALVEHFDLRALFVPSADRTPFPELVNLTACALRPCAR